MIVLLTLVLALLWTAVEGELTLGSLALGLLLGFMVLLPLRPALRSPRPWPALGRTLRLGLSFTVQVLAAGGRVAGAILRPRWISPAWLAVPLDARTDAEIAVLSFLLTLTPDTTVAEISEDRSTLYVYALFVTDPERKRREIKEKTEWPLLRVLR